MNTLIHGNLMKLAILSNCNQEFFVLKDDDVINGSRLVTKEEYARVMLGYASYIAEHCPQLFTAIPRYLQYLSSEVSPNTVSEFLGQCLPVSTTELTISKDDVYCSQSIIIKEKLRLELSYNYKKPITGAIYFEKNIQEKFEIRSMSELCDVIQRYSGEVVEIDS